MNIDQYLSESEHAVRQLFDGIDYYKKILDETPTPVFVTTVPFDDEDSWKSEFEKWQTNNDAEIDESLRKQREYLGLSFSKATLCGSILQIASMAIEQNSTNNMPPVSCNLFINLGQKAVKHCIGRDVRGLPLGIVIYAGRNQYNHWDDHAPHKITKEVFDTLAFGHDYGSFKDPAFDLDNPKLEIYSHNILALIEWYKYEDYEKDLKVMLS